MAEERQRREARPASFLWRMGSQTSDRAPGGFQGHWRACWDKSSDASWTSCLVSHAIEIRDDPDAGQSGVRDASSLMDHCVIPAPLVPDAVDSSPPPAIHES